MKKETQRVIYFLEDKDEEGNDKKENPQHKEFNENQKIKHQQLFLNNYVLMSDEFENLYDDPKHLKDFAKQIKGLKWWGIKWSQVQWDLVGEWLKDRPESAATIDEKESDRIKFREEFLAQNAASEPMTRKVVTVTHTFHVNSDSRCDEDQLIFVFSNLCPYKDEELASWEIKGLELKSVVHDKKVVVEAVKKIRNTGE